MSKLPMPSLSPTNWPKLIAPLLNAFDPYCTPTLSHGRHEAGLGIVAQVVDAAVLQGAPQPVGVVLS